MVAIKSVVKLKVINACKTAISISCEQQKILHPSINLISMTIRRWGGVF